MPIVHEHDLLVPFNCVHACYFYFVRLACYPSSEKKYILGSSCNELV